MVRRIALLFTCFALALALPGCLDFAPDGMQLVFPWEDGLALIKTDGTGLSSVPESNAGSIPVWSPDGKHILFVREADKVSSLILYDTVQKKTTRIGDKFEPPLVWREDGQRFAALHKTEKGESEIVWYNLQGIVSLRLILPFPSVANAKMVWLPDTDNLALIGQEGDKTNVYTLEEGEVKQVTKTNDVIGLALSGDKKKLVWARKSPNLAYILLSLYAYDLTARSVVRMPFPDRVPLLNPDPRHAPNAISYVAFSPDGKRLALLAKTPAGTDPKTKTKLQTGACYTLGIDGSDARLIEQTPPSEKGDGLIAPVWSRDGGQLAVLYADDKRQTLKLYSADGKETNTLKSKMSP